MAKILWPQAVSQMRQNLVKVSTLGGGYGSGFLIPPPPKAPGNLCVITAFHVIKQAHETGATIEIEHPGEGIKISLPSLARSVFVANNRDQAIISFNGPKDFEKLHEVTFLSKDRHYNPGVELGWLGFPDLEVSQNVACFLSGRVSAYLEDKEAYLIDGVSIHGLSGGPVFYCSDDQVVMAGIVTNYYPNPVNNQAWPGLAMFRTINPLMKLYEGQNKKDIPKISG